MRWRRRWAVGALVQSRRMLEITATESPAGFLAAMTEQLAKLPSKLWRTDNEGSADIASAMDALVVQLDCTRVGLTSEAETRGAVDLARACRQPGNRVMAAAVAGGSVRVRKAMTALRQLHQVERSLVAGKREEALARPSSPNLIGDDGHVMRLMLSAMFQGLVDAEATAHIGADPYERTPARTTHRNGTREKTVSTTAGDLMVKIPSWHLSPCTRPSTWADGQGHRIRRHLADLTTPDPPFDDRSRQQQNMPVGAPHRASA